jgi:ABC-type multidrug transport system ATPase subunit
MLGLVKVKDELVGDARMRGISGGEKKRVCIGVELMKKPNVLFLDEPTSGLDSFQALSVIQALKELTLNGTTVVMSVHQPRSSIVSLFDYLIVVSEGKLVYSADNHAAENYFKKLGYECPVGFNLSDFVLD